MTGADAGADDRDEQPEQMTGTDDRGGCRGAAGGTEIFYRPSAPPRARCTSGRSGPLRPFPGPEAPAAEGVGSPRRRDFFGRMLPYFVFSA